MLPPLGGSAAVMRQYANACEEGLEKYVVDFEYAWIFTDAPGKSKGAKVLQTPRPVASSKKKATRKKKL